MSKVLVVFGATGQQGGSVVDFVINDPELSKQFKVRGITRDPSKPAAQALRQKGVDVVKADMDDIESLKKAIHGAHTVFAITSTVDTGFLKTREVAQGKAMADAAVSQGAEYIIFSTLPNVGTISSNKYKHMIHFDAKVEIEDYIRTLPIKSAFFSPGAFMQIFRSMLAPQPIGNGAYAISCIVAPQTELPLIDIVRDAGKYVGAFLAEPDKYEGKVLIAASKTYTFEDVARIISESTGKAVKYQQIAESTFRGFLPPAGADAIVEMLLFFQDFGYNGLETKKLAEQDAQFARGKLATFEDYVKNEPFQLQ
ncbi:hypothetical protein BGZ49_004976 [Haplosporangium sp. Z 27]|nr:hypothetical protein BGZ49_004976 [Haplosporangium sp. Z 27]